MPDAGAELSGPPIAMGIYGKMPAHGDFVRRALPSSFVTPWDAWLAAGIADARERLGHAFNDVWDQAPAWRFSLPAGICGPDAVVGVMLPSQDTVGRRFPITAAAVLGAGGDAGEAWFDRLEAAIRAAREGALDADGLLGAISSTAPLALAPAGSPAPNMRSALVDDDLLGTFAAPLPAMLLLDEMVSPPNAPTLSAAVPEPEAEHLLGLFAQPGPETTEVAAPLPLTAPAEGDVFAQLLGDVPLTAEPGAGDVWSTLLGDVSPEPVATPDSQQPDSFSSREEAGVPGGDIWSQLLGDRAAAEPADEPPTPDPAPPPPMPGDASTELVIGTESLPLAIAAGEVEDPDATLPHGFVLPPSRPAPPAAAPGPLPEAAPLDAAEAIPPAALPESSADSATPLAPEAPLSAEAACGETLPPVPASDDLPHGLFEAEGALPPAAPIVEAADDDALGELASSWQDFEDEAPLSLPLDADASLEGDAPDSTTALPLPVPPIERPDQGGWWSVGGGGAQPMVWPLPDLPPPDTFLLLLNANPESGA